eukprot:CAMPEP_0183345672 /NCGR_PEP_ID=MMETSP0164_2-20130417/11032_1 /TAXON_ID=221442 /ORGANISM="Coccolithus pelagicus ssp braarudi, Strain PLY182g" /LENGTH=96 /DNA_ID=CAMNT_0025516843 /DNA_START=35 /DNA_END=325 /DNA_ORIENTATION=+
MGEALGGAIAEQRPQEQDGPDLADGGGRDLADGRGRGRAASRFEALAQQPFDDLSSLAAGGALGEYEFGAGAGVALIEIPPGFSFDSNRIQFLSRC